MGTITITEYASIGGSYAIDGSPFTNLSASIATTTDATTSSTPENITLNEKTRYVVVDSVEKHRVSVKDSTVAANYEPTLAASKSTFAVNEGDRTLYYRTDA